MANSASSPLFTFILSSLTSILLLSTTAAAAARNNDLINRVCRNTTNAAFCSDVIYSDPHAADADQYFLAYIAFRAAYFNATDTSQYIASKLKSMAADRKSGILLGLRKCQGYYRDAIRTLAEMLGDLDSETFSGLDTLSLEVEGDARACRAAVGGQSVLSRRNENLMKLANICLVISKLYPYH
ncbi:hypothetical protein BUALT_Bualt18G0092300 [Buddleja alternifolia]|uniref:Pectinesterase inhibitor domain-containing protein n=1 Tax=Buddleja alternifolia TaxID=168488 RepID=A0AAV6W5I9_9LAMI|nr:hypothetical protein BUALT_Bualt18G0092300 [Buddleja alternifolia]